MRAILLLFTALSATQLWEIPEKERAVKNPIEVSPAAIAEGEALYKKQCVLCHGEAFKGDGSGVAMFAKKPPDLSTSDARKRLTDGEIFYKMTVGKNPMPSMEGRLSEEQRWKVVVYVRTLQAE